MAFLQLLAFVYTASGLGSRRSGRCGSTPYYAVPNKLWRSVGGGLAGGSESAGVVNGLRAAANIELRYRALAFARG
jgi:hypothetical protein